MALTEAGMRAFRAAATLADVAPMVRVRVHDGERHLCTVSRTLPDGEDGQGDGPALWLAPCTFRAAVGRAHRMHQQGARLCFLDGAADAEPAIDIGLPTGDAVLPGQIYRIRGSGKWLLLFMTVLTAGAAEQAVADALATVRRCTGVEGGQAVPAGCRVGFHADTVTELTVVHTLSAENDAGAAARMMARLLEVCVAAEAIAELGTTVSPAPRSGP